MRSLILIFALVANGPAQSEPLHDAVDAYALYQHDVSALVTLDARRPGAMDEALALALRHDPERVARGFIAYGALTAAQSPAFVAGVRSRVRAAGRAPVLRQLNRDSAYARRRPPGSAEAIALIANAAGSDSARMIAAGARYSTHADSLAYAPADRALRETRSTRLRTLADATRPLDRDIAVRVHPNVSSVTPLTDPDAFGGVRFWDALADIQSEPSNEGRRENTTQSARVNRMLTLAGLLIVDAGETPRVREMLTDTRLSECLEMEQLELRQCASVAASANEDGHCLARHGLAQPAACFAAIAR